MRGFAVAAGGWDEIEEPVAPSLHLIEPADESAATVAPSAAVVDLAEHRERHVVPATAPEAVILAW